MMFEFNIKIGIEEKPPKFGAVVAAIQLLERMYYLELFSRLKVHNPNPEQIYRFLSRPWDEIEPEDVLRMKRVSLAFYTRSEVTIEGTAKDGEAIARTKENMKEYLKRLAHYPKIEHESLREQMRLIANSILSPILGSHMFDTMSEKGYREISVWFVLLSTRLRGVTLLEH
jgi:hypothetical protein